MPAPTLRNPLPRLVLVLAISTGCASTSEQIAERFAKEQGCGILAVNVTEKSSQDYVAEGCGKRIEYVCESFAGMHANATRCRTRHSQRVGAPSPDDKYRSRRDLEPPK